MKHSIGFIIVFVWYVLINIMLLKDYGEPVVVKVDWPYFLVFGVLIWIPFCSGYLCGKGNVKR